jgi:hypothetical protein
MTMGKRKTTDNVRGFPSHAAGGTPLQSLTRLAGKALLLRSQYASLVRTPYIPFYPLELFVCRIIVLTFMEFFTLQKPFCDKKHVNYNDLHAISRLPAIIIPMESLKHKWKSTPSSVRKPIVLVIGMLFVLAAAATGWLPGPGGIPLFLIGIAILASEFAWAERIRDRILGWLHRFGVWYRAHRVIGTLLLVLLAGGGLSSIYFLYFS